jgi:hypothetical protein
MWWIREHIGWQTVIEVVRCVDILVTSAGVHISRPVRESADDEWERL